MSKGREIIYLGFACFLMYGILIIDTIYGEKNGDKVERILARIINE